MNLTFQLIDPGGEALLLVHTPVPREAYAPLTRRLLAIRELSPRQAAFLTAPAQGGVARVECAADGCGGETLRQAAFAYAVQAGIRRERKVPLEGAGWPEPLAVHVNPLTGQAALDLPLPQVGRAPAQVTFPGAVAWAVEKGAALPPEEALLATLPALAEEANTPAAGLLAWDFRARTLRAALWQAQGGLTYPQRCAAGAGAAAAWQALRGGASGRKAPIHQPGGELHVTATPQAGVLRRLTVEGPVDLGPVYTIEF